MSLHAVSFVTVPQSFPITPIDVSGSTTQVTVNGGRGETVRGRDGEPALSEVRYSNDTRARLLRSRRL
jgi:hypothetical protein